MDWSSFFIGVGVTIGVAAVPVGVFIVRALHDWDRAWGYR